MLITKRERTLKNKVEEVLNVITDTDNTVENVYDNLTVLFNNSYGYWPLFQPTVNSVAGQTKINVIFTVLDENYSPILYKMATTLNTHIRDTITINNYVTIFLLSIPLYSTLLTFLTLAFLKKW